MLKKQQKEKERHFSRLAAIHDSFLFLTIFSEIITFFMKRILS